MGFRKAISKFSYKDIYLYDYGAQFYDPALCRFMTIDPMAEKYYSISPYAYCANNPVKFIDPTGMFVDWYQSENDLIWRPSKDNTITENNKTYENIGSTVSIANNDGTFSNFYQNIGFRMGQPLNAFNYIMKNDLQGKYMSNISGLWEQTKIDLMKASVNQGQQDFLNHPLTSATINSVIFVASGGIEGIASLANLGLFMRNTVKTGDSWTIISGIIRDALRGKRNYGLGTGTYNEAMQAGEAWVGKGFTISKDGSSWVSSNGLRQFRPPSYKPK